MTNREEWLLTHGDRALMEDEHIYSQRFAMICRDIVEKIKTEPNYEPPTYSTVMAGAPWGP